jgi:hypothetical protein
MITIRVRRCTADVLPLCDVAVPRESEIFAGTSAAAGPVTVVAGSQLVPWVPR